MTYIFLGLVALFVVQIILYKSKSRSVSLQENEAKIKELDSYVENNMSHYVDEDDNTIFHLIAMEEGVYVNKKNTDISFVDVAKKALKLKLDVNSKNNQGNTPLHYAPKGKDTFDYVKFLVDSGGDVNIKNKNGQTPFMMVCDIGNTYYSEGQDAYDLMKRKVNDLNAVDSSKRSALMYAAKRCNVRIITDLLEVGVDATLVSSDNKTAFDIAYENKLSYYHTSSKPGGDTNVDKHNHSLDEIVRRLKCARDGVEYKYKKFVPKSSTTEVQVE